MCKLRELSLHTIVRIYNVIFVILDRVLERVDFDRRFEQLPQFVPESADMSSPLPQSPRAIISNYKKRGRKVSSLGKLNCFSVHMRGFILPDFSFLLS